MRQLVKAAAIAAGMMAFSGIGFAQCKIVVIDMQEAVVGSNEGKAQNVKFEAKVAEWNKKLDAIKADIETATNKLKAQSSIASATVIEELKRTIDTKNKDLTRTTEDAQDEVDKYRDELLGPIMKTAQDAMNALSAEKGYSLVYDTSAPTSPIVYFSKDCDITTEVKTRMNAKSGVAAPAATTAAPARATPPANTAPTPPRATPTTTTTPPAGGGRGGAQ